MFRLGLKLGYGEEVGCIIMKPYALRGCIWSLPRVSEQERQAGQESLNTVPSE